MEEGILVFIKEVSVLRPAHRALDRIKRLAKGPFAKESLRGGFQAEV
jgi:hypothetical protein